MAVRRSDLDAILASVMGVAVADRPNAIDTTLEIRERLRHQVLVRVLRGVVIVNSRTHLCNSSNDATA
jgi:hypothetical protein